MTFIIKKYSNTNMISAEVSEYTNEGKIKL